MSTGRSSTLSIQPQAAQPLSSICVTNNIFVIDRIYMGNDKITKDWFITSDIEVLLLQIDITRSYV